MSVIIRVMLITQEVGGTCRKNDMIIIERT